MGRTKYDREYKEQALRLSGMPGKTVAQVAKELGISGVMMYRWRREADMGRSKGRAFPGQGRSRDEELARLRRQLRQAELERDILKKAATYFAQHTK